LPYEYATAPSCHKPKRINNKRSLEQLFVSRKERRPYGSAPTRCTWTMKTFFVAYIAVCAHYVTTGLFQTYSSRYANRYFSLIRAYTEHARVGYTLKSFTLSRLKRTERRIFRRPHKNLPVIYFRLSVHNSFDSCRAFPVRKLRRAVLKYHLHHR